MENIVETKGVNNEQIEEMEDRLGELIKACDMNCDIRTNDAAVELFKNIMDNALIAKYGTADACELTDEQIIDGACGSLAEVLKKLFYKEYVEKDN